MCLSGSQIPSAKIDATICNLVLKINEFSDEDFDAYWLQIRDTELELIVMGLLEEVRQNLTGQQLVFHLLQIRQHDLLTS